MPEHLSCSEIKNWFTQQHWQCLCDSQFSYTLLRVWTPPSCDSRHGSKWLFSFVLWGSYAQTFPILLYSNQFSSLCSFRVQVDFFLNYIPKLGHIFYDFVSGQKRHTELHQVSTDQSRIPWSEETCGTEDRT